MTAALSRDEARAIIEPFYDLFSASRRDWDKGLAPLADGWVAYSTNTVSRGKQETRAFLQRLFEIVPDIDVEILQVSADDDVIAVRSELSGTPATDFMVPHTGRSFRIMTIDIHRMRDGKLVELYHLEDWGTAVKQLSGQSE